MYRRVLTKVRVVLEDEDQIKKIMEKYKKQEESKEEYKKKIRSRIEDLCRIAGVEYEDYLKALGSSKSDIIDIS